jgi:formamidopyrimidine-DNA glycosylase
MTSLVKLGRAGLLIHLGMSGRLVLKHEAHSTQAHTHVIFKLRSGEYLHYIDPRRFGLISTLAKSERLLTNLGFEPLATPLLDKKLATRAKNCSQRIKVFLMNASIVVGVGNIYASESLFLAGIHPERTASSLSIAEWKRLVRSIKKTLKAAIRHGGTTLRDYRTIDDTKASNQFHLYVYDQRQCRICASGVQRIVIAQRSSYFCPQCQILPSPKPKEKCLP